MKLHRFQSLPHYFLNDAFSQKETYSRIGNKIDTKKENAKKIVISHAECDTPQCIYCVHVYVIYIYICACVSRVRACTYACVTVCKGMCVRVRVANHKNQREKVEGAGEEEKGTKK